MRQEAGEQQHTAHCAHRQRIAWRHVEQQTAQQLRASERSGKPNHQSKGHQPTRFAQHHAQNVSPIRADGQAHPNFFCPASYGIRHHPVKTRGSQQQRNEPEAAEQQHGEVLLCHGRADHVLHLLQHWTVSVMRSRCQTLQGSVRFEVADGESRQSNPIIRTARQPGGSRAKLGGRVDRSPKW
jgi:hypothetical protein